ncbi:MAG: DUF3899 domain-containing protein [Faecousia sp.]
MSEKGKANLIKYGSCALFVAVMAWVYIAQRDFAGAELVDKFRYLADAFTVPGVLLVMAGALVWASNQGAMDGLGYSVGNAVRSLIPGGRAKPDETYADYVERKRANRVKGYGFLFLSGGIAVAIALVFMVLFYCLYE